MLNRAQLIALANTVRIRVTTSWYPEQFKTVEFSFDQLEEFARLLAPTNTMEQEFQAHYRRGFEAGKKAAKPSAAPEPVAYLVDWSDIGEGASQSLFYDENAKKHMEDAVRYAMNARGRSAKVTPLYAAPTRELDERRLVWAMNDMG
jgi:hypothetical protein